MCVVEKGTVAHWWQNVYQCTHCGKKYVGSSKKKKNKVPHHPAIPLLRTQQRKLNQKRHRNSHAQVVSRSNNRPKVRQDFGILKTMSESDNYQNIIGLLTLLC
jgi:hypothetical protein